MSENWTPDPNEWEKKETEEIPNGMVVANQLNWMVEQGLGYWDQDGEFCTTFQNSPGGEI